MFLICAVFGAGAAFADDCAVGDDDMKYVANSNKILWYCPICRWENNNVKQLYIKSVSPADDGYVGYIKLNGENLDMSYLYVPTEKKGVYRNLAYVVGCKKRLGDYRIKEYLDEVNPYGFYRIRSLALDLEACGDEACVADVYQKISEEYKAELTTMNVKVQNDGAYEKEAVKDVLLHLAYMYGYD